VRDAPHEGPSRVAELRRSFDAAFAAAPRHAGANFHALLAIGIAGKAHAIRASEISHLARLGKLVAVPGPVPELLGITAVSGALAAVYDLGALLGYPPAADPPAWLVLCGERDARLALAFDRFEHYIRVPSGDLYAADEALAGGHVRDVVRVAPAVRPVIAIGSIIAAIKGRIGPGGPAKER